MDRRRAAGLLLAVAACFATAAAAPTTSNHTALDIYDGSPDGCYYNFQHYGEGDRIMTNEPCLNCTCHNRMLMCYLRVCPFTKAIGQDCSVEKRADQCCPIVTCPDVPVDLLTSTTTSPAEYGPTGMGKLDKFGCSINGKYFPEGSKVPPTPNKPCEHCYCIRNMTTCVMQECTLHVDGCTPIYHKDVCCPVRYSCDHPEDEMPLLDDMSTTVRPTPGFLLTTTTVSPVTQMSQDCVYDNRIFPDGALIKTEKACDHCYCMKGDIVCVVQECGTPMENEGKNCTALPPREGVCCPDTYICEGDEITTATNEPENLTTLEIEEKLTTLSPPRRTSSEGSGYRIEPDDVAYTERPEITSDIEGSGEEDDRKPIPDITTDKYPTKPADEVLTSTEETHEYIPLTTTKSEEEIIPEATTTNKNIFDVDVDRTTEAQISSTTHDTYDSEKPVTDKHIVEDIGSGDMSIDVYDTTKEDILPVPEVTTTNIYEQNTLSPGLHELSVAHIQTTSAPIIGEEITVKPIGDDTDKSDEDNQKPILSVESDITTVLPDENMKEPGSTESDQTKEEDTKDIEPSSESTIATNSEEETTKPTEYDDESSVTPKDLDTQHYLSSTTAASDDEYITTEYQELITDERKKIDHSKLPHVTVSTPMLEEIEKETTGYSEPGSLATTGTIHEDGLSILDTTPANILVQDEDKKDLPGDDLSAITKHPIFDEYTEKVTENPTASSEHENVDKYQPSILSEIGETESKTTVSSPTTPANDDKQETSVLGTSISPLEKEEATTEPDKGLNTIPSDSIDEHVSISPEVQKTTLEENYTPTDTSLDNKYGPEQEGEILSPPGSQEEISAVTTESTSRKEDHSPTEADINEVKSTTEVIASGTEEVTPILTHEHTESTESNLDTQRPTDTTFESTHTESTQETTFEKTTLIDTALEITTSKPSVETEKITTSVPLYEKETTTANQEDNEIFNEPRIPGEGDCLLNGVTYSNESAVPSSHKCQSGCKCVSSIIKCDPIICSPPPEYMHNMDNCETIYDTPDACCPTYICDHKTETIPPQSHSQMSGTESPVVSPLPCQGDACDISTEKIHSILPSEDCKSGSCSGSLDESTVPRPQPIDQIPDKISTDKQDGCSEETGCQALPVQPCEGEKCETVTDITLPPKTKPCDAGEDCKDLNIPSGECAGSNCDTANIPSSYPKETCSEKEGCTNEPIQPEEVCKDDKCRRKETSSLDQRIPQPCEGPNCKQSEPDAESSTTPSSQQSSQIGEEADKKMTTVDLLEQMETSKEPESSDIATDVPYVPSDETITTVSDNLKPVSNEIEATTKLSDFSNAQEHVGGDYTTESNEPHSTELPDYHLPVSTVILGSDNEPTTQEVIHPTTEKIGTEVDKLPKVTEPTNTVISEDQEPSTVIAGEMQPEDHTEISKIHEPEAAVTEAHDEFMPSKETDENENITDNILEVNTDLPNLQDDMNKPESTQPAIVDESDTELLDKYTTPSHKVTKISDTTEYEEFITVTPQSVPEHDRATGKVTDLTDTTKATVEISAFETSTTSTDDVPNVTRKDSEYDSTTQIIESVEEHIASSLSPAHISTVEIEASTAEPSKTTITETSDVSKLSESSDTEAPITTEKILEKFSTESIIDFTPEHYGTTLSQDDHTTTGQFEDNPIVPSQSEGANQLDKKYPDETKPEITETASEFEDTYITTPKSYDDYKTTVFISSEQSATQTEAPKESDAKETSSLIPESSSETSITHDSSDQDEFTETNVFTKPDETPETEKSPVEKDHAMVTNIVEEMTTEPSKLYDINTEKPELPVNEDQEITTPKIAQQTEQPSPTITESYDMPILPEESLPTDKPVSDTESPSKPELNSATEETDIQPEPIGSTTTSSSNGPEIMTPQDDTKETTESLLDPDSTRTESLLSEITTPKDHNILSTVVTESDVIAHETQKPNVDQTYASLSPDSDTPKIETTEQPEKTSKKDISPESETDKDELDELRTTSPEIQELTTSKPTDMTQLSQDTDTKPDQPEKHYTQYEEQSTEKLVTVPQEASTGEIVTDSETESSEKPAQSDSDLEKSETYVPEITPVDKITTEKSYTGEIKYSPTESSDHTDRPVFENTKEPHKHEDGLIQSLVTEKYDEPTKPVIIEEDYHTQTTIQTSSSPDDVTVTLLQKDDKDKLYTTPSSLVDTTHKDHNDEFVPPSEHKPTDEEIRTEKPSTDKSVNENTTEKNAQSEDNADTQEYSTFKPEEQTASASPLDKITTERYEEPVEPTEKIVPETEKPFVYSDVVPADTEKPLISEPSDAEQTESVPEVTKPSDVEAQTEPSNIPILKPDSGKQDEDENIAATSTSSEKESDSTTLKPSAETDSVSLFESTTASRQEDTTDASEDAVVTEKNNEENNVTPPAKQDTTESKPSDEQLDTTTALPEKATSVEDLATTRKEMESDIHETPVTVSEDINDISTRPTPSESQDIEQKPQAEEQPIPVITQTEKTSEDSVATQTERIIPASEKPLHETTAPEEEFIIATSKTTTTQVEETTLSPTEEKTTSQDDLLQASKVTPTEEAESTASDAIVTAAPETTVTKLPAVSTSSDSETTVTKSPEIEEHEPSQATISEESETKAPEQPFTSAPKQPEEIASEQPVAPEEPISNVFDLPSTPASDTVPEETSTSVPESPFTSAPELSVTIASDAPVTSSAELDASTTIKEHQQSATALPETASPDSAITVAPELPEPTVPEEPSVVPEMPVANVPELLITDTPEVPYTNADELPTTAEPELPSFASPEAHDLPEPESTEAPELPIPVSTGAPEEPARVSTEAAYKPSPAPTEAPEVPTSLSTDAPEVPTSESTESPKAQTPESTEVPKAPTSESTEVPKVPTFESTEVPEVPTPESSEAPEVPKPVSTEAPDVPAPVSTEVPEVPKPVSTEAPEVPKPVSTDAQPTDDTLTPDEESFPPSGGTSGYGQEPDYVEEDQTFGPGTCRYGGKVYVSAQQIPRDDPCDFCFCFRSDIICLQQSCPPPIHGCHEEPIQGFCCPRYECPVSMATTVNVTTTTTTTTTTLPPHFPTHSYKGSVQKRGCQIKGQTYKVGEVVRSSSGPCLHCTCGGDGQMKCDPKVCTPEPMLRQMIAAAVSAKRRR